jgi:hypothetical protein
MTKYWTAVGSREVPAAIADLQVLIGACMTSKGYILRSGNANGSDYNFQRGAQSVSPPHCDIYLPWASYNRELNKAGSSYITPTDAQMEFAGGLLEDTGVMPYYKSIKSEHAKKMHSRNVYQVIGVYDQPREVSRVCIYYAPLDKDGNVMGGTRTAVGLSKYYEIPTFNLFVESEKAELLKKLGLADV